MAKTILQRVTLKAGPRELFETYLDSKKHSAATGAKARISKKAGARFTAWDGYIQGRNLHVQAGRLVVQAWRGSNFGGEDSILILRFDKAPGGGRITMVHANVPDARAASIAKGWHTHYWKPWRAYLRSRAKKK